MYLKFKKITIILLGIIFFAVGSYFIIKKNQNPQIIYHKNFELDETKVCYNNFCRNVELAKTPEERAKGLMFRTGLADNEGMLFIFENPGIHKFWMKNTLIPLCMIWLDESGKILYFTKAEPCGEEFSKINACPTYFTNKPAKYVLEVNSKFCKNLKINEKIKNLQ